MTQLNKLILDICEQHANIIKSHEERLIILELKLLSIKRLNEIANAELKVLRNNQNDKTILE